VEAKESALKLEANSWEIKRQQLVSEHALKLRQSQTQSNTKIAQLERELSRIRSQLEDAHEENERLVVSAS